MMTAPSTRFSFLPINTLYTQYFYSTPSYRIAIYYGSRPARLTFDRVNCSMFLDSVPCEVVHQSSLPLSLSLSSCIIVAPVPAMCHVRPSAISR
jgi:hypothetical protein